MLRLSVIVILRFFNKILLTPFIASRKSSRKFGRVKFQLLGKKRWGDGKNRESDTGTRR
jgi:hypothetical protein